MSRPIDYLESAVSDRPHSQMDKLLFEDEMSNIQPMQFSGEVTPENLRTYTTKRLQSMENPSAKGRNLLIEVHDLIKPQLHRNSLIESLGQQPQHSMRTYQEGYDPAREWGEGMMPIGGALKLLKGSDKYLDMLKSVSKTAVKEKKNWEAMTDLARGGSKGQIKETPKEFLKWYKKDADKAGKDYATTKWIQRLLQ